LHIRFHALLSNNAAGAKNKDYEGNASPSHHDPIASYGEEGSAEEEFLEKEYHSVGLSDQKYPPEPPLGPSYGFPTPQVAFDNSTGGQEATARLYRSQTSAEAWSKRQKVNRTRAKTIKVKLSKGNFVHEYPVPSQYFVITTHFSHPHLLRYFANH
jgi:hypothetical protein